MEDCGPLSFAALLPNYFAVEEGGYFGGGEVAVEVEVFLSRRVRWGDRGRGGLESGGSPLGGEDEGGVEGTGVGGGFLDLVDAEVLDGDDFEAGGGCSRVSGRVSSAVAGQAERTVALREARARGGGWRGGGGRSCRGR